MSGIYIFYGQYRNKSEELLRKAAGVYSGLELSSTAILRTERGKPYFSGLPLFFSISHTDGIWGCFISEAEAGFDVQIKRNVDHNRLAGRFFLNQEAEYVRRNGSDGFFEIWGRKEACVKYLGKGMFRDMRSFSTVQWGELAERIDVKGGICYINSFVLREDVKCAYCGGFIDDEVKLWEL